MERAPGGFRVAVDESVKVQFGRWLAMSKADRRAAGLPESQSKMAAHLEVAAKTLTRWKNEDSTVRGVWTEEQNRASQAPAAEEQEGAPASDEATVEELKRSLIVEARKDPQALNAYMRWFGQDELERQKAREESGFADLEDEDLIEQTLSLIGVETVEAWLARQ